MDTLADFNKLWDYNDPVTTEKKFRELIPGAEAAGDESYRLQLLTQIARTLGLQGKFDEAHEVLDKVSKELKPLDKIILIRYNLERGRIFNSSGNTEDAALYFNEALQLSRKQDQDYYAVDAAHMLAIVSKGNKALDWNLQAVKLAETSGDPKSKKWLGSLYNNIGWTFHDMKEYEKSMEYFVKAKDWHEKFGTEKTVQIAWWCMAKGERYLGDVEKALEILDSLEEEGKNDGYLYEELGECHMLKGNRSLASMYFSKAYELLSKDEWLKTNEAERLQRLKELSEL